MCIGRKGRKGEAVLGKSECVNGGVGRALKVLVSKAGGVKHCVSVHVCSHTYHADHTAGRYRGFPSVSKGASLFVP